MWFTILEIIIVAGLFISLYEYAEYEYYNKDNKSQ